LPILSISFESLTTDESKIALQVQVEIFVTVVVQTHFGEKGHWQMFFFYNWRLWYSIPTKHEVSD